MELNKKEFETKLWLAFRNAKVKEIFIEPNGDFTKKVITLSNGSVVTNAMGQCQSIFTVNEFKYKVVDGGYMSDLINAYVYQSISTVIKQGKKN